MNLSNIHFAQGMEQSDTIEQLSNKINPILKKEFERFFLLGMGEVTRDVNNSLDTILANVNNDKLSDADFRQLTKSIVNIMKDKL